MGKLPSVLRQQRLIELPRSKTYISAMKKYRSCAMRQLDASQTKNPESKKKSERLKNDGALKSVSSSERKRSRGSKRKIRKRKKRKWHCGKKLLRRRNSVKRRRN